MLFLNNFLQFALIPLIHGIWKKEDHAKVYKNYFKPKNSLRTKKINTLEPLSQEQLTIAQD